MSRNSHNPRGSSTYARKQTPRLRTILITLLLLFTIESMPQAAPAHAAPPTTKMRYFLMARNLKGDATICIDDNVPIKVSVFRAEMTGIQGDNPEPIGGIHITTLMSPSGIGTVSPLTASTGKGSDGLTLGYVDFKFHADKEGTTVITFQGQIPRSAAEKIKNSFWSWITNGNDLPSSRTVKGFLEIKVEKCNYKVTAITKWTSTTKITVKIDATIDKCGLIDDGSGKKFKGTCSMEWNVTGSQLVDCNSPKSTTTSQVDATGDLSNDELKVTLNFQAANIDFKVKCSGSGGGSIDDSMRITMQANKTNFTVAATGGAAREDLILKSVETVSGYMVAGVWRVR